MEISFDGVNQVTERLQETLEKFPDGRRRVVEQIAAALLAEVRGQIGGAGKVQSWQTSAVGSKAGYAAVRPKSKTYVMTKSGKKYAVGYITNAITSGHRIRPPAGKSKRYQPRIKTPRVPGKGFYEAAGENADAVAWNAAEALVDELAGTMEG